MYEKVTNVLPHLTQTQWCSVNRVCNIGVGQQAQEAIQVYCWLINRPKVNSWASSFFS